MPQQTFFSSYVWISYSINNRGRGGSFEFWKLEYVAKYSELFYGNIHTFQFVSGYYYVKVQVWFVTMNQLYYILFFGGPVYLSEAF